MNHSDRRNYKRHSDIWLRNKKRAWRRCLLRHQYPRHQQWGKRTCRQHHLRRPKQHRLNNSHKFSHGRSWNTNRKPSSNRYWNDTKGTERQKTEIVILICPICSSSLIEHLSCTVSPRCGAALFFYH